MKKIKFFVLLVVVMLFTACHDKLWDSIEDLDSRVTKLEELCKEMNTNISALQTIVSVIQENDFITGIVPIEKGGEVIGYTIMFGKHEPITIYNGEDGKDGQNGIDGYTPILGVAKDVDGVYYWTLNGEWLLDDEGNKLPVSGKNGNDGENGEGSDGESGTAGKDGVTPQLKIENGYWYVSYDNGAIWTELGKAVGEDGEKGDKGDKGDAGEKGDKGDSMFTSVTYDENNVYFTLTDGSVLIVPRGNSGGAGENDPSDIIKFEDLKVKSALLKINIDINKDGEISYEEAANYTGSLEIKNNTNILSFKELQYFTGVNSVSFDGCTNLFEVALPNTLDSILDRAFYNCMLISIEIPNSVTSIGNYAFGDCNNLISITIPESVTSIGNYAFYGCFGLTSAIIGNSVTSIGDYAFSNCSSLTSITIPNSVTKIKNGVFEDCKYLSSVIIGNSVTSIGNYAFKRCSSLYSVYSKNPIPPILGSYDVFTSIGIIYVPTVSVDAYKTKWSQFADKIVGYNFIE